MGVLCEIFIADRDRAVKYCYRGKCNCESLQSCKCWVEYDSTTYEHIESRRIYAHNFAQLLSILRGVKYTEKANKEFRIITQIAREGPWIQMMPKDLPVLLSSRTKNELQAIADEWGEQISPGESIPTKLIIDYLELLQKLCKKAIKLKKNVYLWTCL